MCVSEDTADQFYKFEKSHTFFLSHTITIESLTQLIFLFYVVIGVSSFEYPSSDENIFGMIYFDC